MNSPMFSIVVPTRNGGSTLEATLRTCLAQTFDDYEIIVADNASTDNTPLILERLSSDRIKYFRSEMPLSMTSNWNRALSHANGEWVTFLGADDGIRSRSLEKLDELVRNHDCKSVNWSQSIYTWPTLAEATQANKLSIPPITKQIETHDSKSDLFALLAGDSFPNMPSIYYGLIHRSLIDEALRTGPVFQGRSPDVYSAILFGALTDKYLNLEDPLTLTGLSANSNGMAHFTNNEEMQPLRDDFFELNQRDDVALHPEIPDVDVTCVVVWDALFRVRDRLDYHATELKLSKSEIARRISDQIFRTGTDGDAQLEEFLSFMEINGIDPIEMGISGDFDLLSPPEFLPLNGQLGKLGRLYVLNAEEFGVRNVSDACKFVDKVEDVSGLLEMAQVELEGRTQQHQELSELWQVERTGLYEEISALRANKIPDSPSGPTPDSSNLEFKKRIKGFRKWLALLKAVSKG